MESKAISASNLKLMLKLTEAELGKMKTAPKMKKFLKINVGGEVCNK